MYQLTFKRLFVGLLLALLTGCSTVKYVREAPPAELLADCPVPVIQVKTNGQLAVTAIALQQALVACNIDKESLREWAK
jgi:hypothetical protein